jgi:LacI family transcriptional regulator
MAHPKNSWCSATEIPILYRYSFFRMDKSLISGSKNWRAFKSAGEHCMPPDSTPPDERPTLKTIAYLTGLGVTTVSRALKDGPEIGEDTRQRVKLIAQQIGYRPNRAGVRLRTGKTNVISLILNVQDEGYGFLSAFIYGISEALADTQYHLVVTPYSLADPMEPVRYIVETRSADGIIISRTEANDPRVRYMQAHGMAFATHGRTEIEKPHAYCDYDNAEFGQEAIRRLLARGRRKIALLGPPSSLYYRKHTVAGFLEGMQQAGLPAIVFDSIDTDAPMNDIKAFGEALGRSADRPDGFVCSSAMGAMCLISGLEAAGLQIGRDFDLAAKQASVPLHWYRSEIITIDEDFRAAGASLAASVRAVIDGIDPATLQVLLKPPL